jgi:NTP pyrophosphatase (non-canonical NTP hydrolase)
MKIDETILKRAIQIHSEDQQCEMIIEECIELALALQKLKRKRGDPEEKLKNVIDEIADVSVMIKQAQIIFDSEKIQERIDYKMNRLEKRLDVYDNPNLKNAK